MKTPISLANFILAYEDGTATHLETIKGFQELINSGLVWKLKESYGMMASYLIDEGYCQPTTE